MTDTRPLDLTPREARVPRRRAAWLPWLVLVAMAGTIAVLLWVLMSNSQAFLEADVAVAEREEQGDRRFQLLGSPIADADREDTVIVGGEEVTPFTIVFDGVLVDVVSQGTPPDLFEAGVPVVLEGQWVRGAAPVDRFVDGANDGWYFAADRVLVKHDNDYREDRLDDADYRGQVESANT
jgi:cytochrome c-type biogenesis protein CcmE